MTFRAANGQSQNMEPQKMWRLAGGAAVAVSVRLTGSDGRFECSMLGFGVTLPGVR
jgi:hypothetical protein